MISNLQTAAPARAYRDSTATLVERFAPMVRKLAWHMHGFSRAGVEPEDLVQAGLVALTECAQRHGGNDTDGFAAYAKIRVRGAMIDHLRRAATICRSGMAKRRKLAETRKRLENRLGRPAGELEMAAELGLDIAAYQAMVDAAQAVQQESIDEVYSDNDMAFADGGPDSLAILEDEELREHLLGAIAALPERLQLVIQLYFVEELNLAEIAQVLTVSIPRVHQLKAKAIEHLRSELAGVAEVL